MGCPLLLSLVAALFHRLSLVVVREGCSLVAVCGLLIAVVFLVGSLDSRCTGFSSCDAWVLEHSLSRCGSQAQLPCNI